MTLKIGFEFEFLHPQRGYDKLEARLSGSLGLDFNRGDDDGTDASYYSKWHLDDDGSIRSRSAKHDEYCDYELISPIMPIDEGVKEMDRVFRWMKESGAVTNDTTGFHVNMSLPKRQMENLDRLKLVMLVKEKKWLKKFDREDNEYCEPHRPAVYRSFRYTHNLDQIRGQIDNEKYRAINFGKSRRAQPWIEFRILGGEDYHLRRDEIKEAIGHFGQGLIAACDPELEKEKFLAKITKHSGVMA